MGRSQRSRCAGFTSGSIDRTASVHRSSITGTAYPQPKRQQFPHDFRVVHADSPSLSTTKGQAKSTRSSPPRSFALPLASSVTVRRVHRAVEVLYQTASSAIKRQTGRVGQDRENQRDNFFRVVADSTRGWNRGRRGGLITRRTGAHFLIPAELESGPSRNSRHFTMLDGGKSHDMGVGARPRARQVQSPDGDCCPARSTFTRDRPKTRKRGPPGGVALTRRIRDAIKFDLCGAPAAPCPAREPETFRRTS